MGPLAWGNPVRLYPAFGPSSLHELSLSGGLSMPGAYAHMTLVNALKQPKYAQPAGIPGHALYAVGTFLAYCELGAVSPDYPYLAIGDVDQNKWADRMHYERTGEMIKAGVCKLRSLDGPARNKVLAWLLGYSAHVATDVTIHPVIELKVGRYAENKTRHRVCEMNQDVYVYSRFGAGHLAYTEHLKTGIGACHAPGQSALLDPDISTVWRAMLEEVYPDFARKSPPDLDKWHGGFNLMIGDLAAQGHHFVTFARHLLEGVGLTYPEMPSDEFVKNLPTPGGGTESYDQVFERALKNVGKVWADVGRAVDPAQPELVASIRNWDLDTGRDDTGKIGFWEVA